MRAPYSLRLGGPQVPRRQRGRPAKCLNISAGLKERLAKQVTLHEAHAQVSQTPEFVGRFHSLGDNIDAELCANPRHSSHDRSSRRALVYLAYQIHVELHNIWLEICEEVESGESSPEVVDGRQETDALVLAQHLGQPLAIVNTLPLDGLENDAVYRESVCARPLQRRADADLRSIDRVRHEVDRELGLQTKLRCPPDSPYTTGLIEAITICHRDSRQYRRCGLPVRATHQRFVREDSARLDIDDWLVRVGESEAETLAFAAGTARIPLLVLLRVCSWYLDHGVHGTLRESCNITVLQVFGRCRG